MRETPDFFPEGSSSTFWTSTTYEAGPSSAWQVDFKNGVIHNFALMNDKVNGRARVWLVRGGIPQGGQ